uniref:Putative glutathione s-transferase n=1 Tax=Amblyomma aureolatum TaxID=187763 RepID=A0A1E1X6S2_9ACAR
MSLTLYNLPGSPPCGFIQALAQLLGIVLNIRNLNFEEKEHFSPEYLKINPFHKVPAIDDNGFTLYESSAIAYYMLRKYAPESELYPANITSRARIDQILAVLSSNLHPQSAVFFRPRFSLQSKPSAEEVATYEQNVIKGFEHLLGDGKFAVGDTLTIADLSLVSHLTLALEIDCVEAAKFLKLFSYYERVKSELPCFEKVFRPVINHVKQVWANLK